MKISAVLITFNEEANIEAALRSLSGIADEIIVVDSFSADRTVKLARAFTDKVVTRKWTNYSDQKNLRRRAGLPPLDPVARRGRADLGGLRTEILALRGEDPSCAGFSMPRLVFYLGRWIRHCGWYPDRKVRLFRKDAARWEGEYVHEKLAVRGRNPDASGIPSTTSPTATSATTWPASTSSPTWAPRSSTPRAGSAAGPICSLFPFGRFLKSYVLKRGFLDGFAGIVVSVLNGYSIFVRYAKLGEIWKKGERIEPFPD